MRPKSATSRSFVAASVFMLFCGSSCDAVTDIWSLPEEVPVDGIQVFQGRRIETLSEVRISDQRWLELRIRRTFPNAGLPGTLDLVLVPLDGGTPGTPRLIGEGFIDSPRPRHAGGGVYWGLRDPALQRLPDRQVPVGTLVAVTVEGAVLREEPAVASWSNFSPEVLLLNRYEVSSGDLVATVELPDGRTRQFRNLRLGPRFIDDQIYFIDEDEVFFRIADFSASREALRTDVSRITFGPGNLRDDFAVMTVAQPQGRATVLFDLDERSEVRLPGSRICCWLPFEGRTFVYAEGRSAQGPARLNRYHLTDGTHTVEDLPEGLSDATRFVFRPNSNERLVEDSTGRFALLQPGSDPPSRLLDVSPLGPRYSRDGSFVLYVEKDPDATENEGRLIKASADFSTREVLSPTGTILRPGNYFTVPLGGDTEDVTDDRELVVFWARFGRAGSDLYFFDPADGQTRFIASAIRNVSVTPSRIFGILRTSQQDLTGDLVERSLPTGDERVFAHSVETYGVLGGDPESGEGDLLVFVVRNRAPTAQDGVWIQTLP